jgi:hypothetical protein
MFHKNKDYKQNFFFHSMDKYMWKLLTDKQTMCVNIIYIFKYYNHHRFLYNFHFHCHRSQACYYLKGTLYAK